jgi:recombination protein RecT
MNAIVPTNGRAPVQIFLDKVLTPDRLAELNLPAHIPADKFRRNLYTALVRNPKLLECSPRDLFVEVAAAASLGLLFDPALGEAYLIVRKGKPQLQTGYRGLIKLVRHSGLLHSVYAEPVHRRDHFEAQLGDEKRLVHKPNWLQERGDVVLYYAVARFSPSPQDCDWEIMTLDQIEGIRARSDGWRAFKAGQIRSNPWQTDEIEMSKKTVLRRLMKRLPQSPEASRLLEREDTIEEAEYTDVPEAAPKVSRRRKPASDEASEARRRAADAGQQHAVDSPAPGSQVGDTVDVPGAGELEERVPAETFDDPSEWDNGVGESTEIELARDAGPDWHGMLERFNSAAIVATTFEELEAAGFELEDAEGMPRAIHEQWTHIHEQQRRRLADLERKRAEAEAQAPGVDPKDPDYLRGLADAKQGRAKCLNSSIKNAPPRLEAWRAGVRAGGLEPTT